MAKAFAKWVRRHPDDGRWILSNGYDWCYFTVEDTGYFVLGLTVGEVVTLRLSDDTSEPMDPRGLTVDDDGVLRVRVKEGAEAARFSRQAQLSIGPLLADEEPLAVVLNGRRFVVEDTPNES